MVLGDPANTYSSDLKKHDELIVPTCFTGLRSDEMVAPSKHTSSLAVIVSSPSRSGGPLLPSKVEPYLEPARRSSVLSAFNLSLFAQLRCQRQHMTTACRRLEMCMCETLDGSKVCCHPVSHTYTFQVAGRQSSCAGADTAGTAASHHGLHGSAGTVLTAITLSYGKWRNSTPRRIKTPSLVEMKL